VSTVLAEEWTEGRKKTHLDPSPLCGNIAAATAMKLILILQYTASARFLRPAAAEERREGAQIGAGVGCYAPAKTGKSGE
jgi:hypothetical protein